ncbi:polyprotein [Sclerotinia sclerotiorum betaendornavirus 1]|uniref:Genome polyprotein n=1 Tax=Sclerotinia sclerotiorum betaendornavirus 1 TaxID=2003398 RepID=X2J276_9VIRU|nr:polyprotein [Sclerotinia sclerotiorum betaendornavirus 1]AHN50398.1 polyprotein [Sclerotinia sclerotiorum betaendornavirus 1]
MSQTITNTTITTTTITDAQINTHKRAFGSLSKDYPNKNHQRGLTWFDVVDPPKQQKHWPKLTPNPRWKKLSTSKNAVGKAELGGETQVMASYNCWQCIFGYDLGIDTAISLEMIKMTIMCQPEDAAHIQIQASYANGMLHIANPPGLPTGEMTPELFNAQRKFVEHPIDGCIKLIDLVDLYDEGTMVGFTPRTITEKLANDIGVDVNSVDTQQLKKAISDSVNSRGTKAVTKFTDQAIILPTSCPEEIVNDLNNEFGNATFIRGNKEHHPHIYHNASRKAVTNLLCGWHGRDALIYDIGGNPASHLNAGRFTVHSVYSKNQAADNARHIKWSKQCVAWARRNMNNENNHSVVNGVANSILKPNSALWCSDGINKCVHSSKHGSFGISIDTLFHLPVNDLFDFYIRNKVFHSVHAITLPTNYSYARNGALKYNEGHWYKKNDDWTIEFNGESLAYSQSVALTDTYLTVPLHNIGEMVVYCKVSGYKGAHLIIEHYLIDRAQLDQLYLKHVMWFNTNMDELFVMVPRINMDQSTTVMGRIPYTMEQVVINVRFYERLLNRLMQSYTWDSVLSYAAGLIGRVYATSSGLHMKWNLTNSQVRDHCLIAYWTTNRINESIKPLLAQAEHASRDPDFLTSLWNSLKNWLKDFGSQFDPTGNNTVQKFIADNKGDTLRLIQMFNSTVRSVESLNVATQMVHSRSVVDWVASSTGVSYRRLDVDIDTWRLNQDMSGNKMTVYDHIEFKDAKPAGVNIGCSITKTCTHDHKPFHLHLSDLSRRMGNCACCGVVSNLNITKLCTICSDILPCHGKNLRCTHIHEQLNDECCLLTKCTCKKDKNCSCCGLPSVGTYCKVCQFLPDKATNKQPTNSVNNNSTTVAPIIMKPTTERKDAPVRFTFEKPQVSNTQNEFKKNESATHPLATNNDSLFVTLKEQLVDDVVTFDDKTTIKSDDAEIRSVATESIVSVEASVDAIQLNDNNIEPLLPEEEVAGTEQISTLMRAVVSVDDVNPGHADTVLTRLPPRYQGGVAVRVVGYTDVPGDGTCGAHALSVALGLNVDEVKHWLTVATGHDDWHNSEELAACALAYGRNLICVDIGDTTIYRGGDQDYAGSIIHGTVVGCGAHWLAGNCNILSYSSLFTNKLISDYTNLLRAAHLTLNGSDQTALAYSHSDLDVDSIIDMNGSIIISREGISVQHEGGNSKCQISDKSDDIKMIIGPTGSGKTTTAFQHIEGKVLLITPLRSAVNNSFDYLKNKVKVVARAQGAWIPDNINIKDITKSDLVIMTMETLYSGIFIGQDKKNIYHQLVSARAIICDEVHEISPHYARLLTVLPKNKTYICSATMPGIKLDYNCKFDVTTNFVQGDIVDYWFNEVKTSRTMPLNTCYIVGTKNECKFADMPNDIKAINSSTINEVTINEVNRCIATNIVTTSITMPQIANIIDLGVRITSDVIVKPYLTDVEKDIRFFNYSKRLYSWAEMTQARGRVGRVSDGQFYGPCPDKTTRQSNIEAMLNSCYTRAPCYSGLLHEWQMITQKNYDEAVNHFTKLGNTFDSKPKWWDEFQSWQESVAELLQCKNANLQPVFVDEYIHKEDILALIPNYIGTNPISTSMKHNKNRVGALRYSCAVDWDNVLPKHLYETTDNIDFESLVISVPDSSQFLNIETDSNEEIASKLRLLAIASILNAIKGLMARGQIYINTNKWSDQHGQYILYDSLEDAQALSGINLSEYDIIGLVDIKKSSMRITHYQQSNKWVGYVIVPTYKTHHYMGQLTDIGLIRDRQAPLVDTLRNSTLYVGPPGSGKTTMMVNENKSSYTTTISSGQLKNHGTWLPPSLIPHSQENINIDEIGLLDVSVILSLASRSNKLTGTGDISQVVHIANETNAYYTGFDSGIDLFSKYANKIYLDKTHRFGPLTCNLVAKLGFDINPTNIDKIEEIKGYVCATNDNKSYSKVLIASEPDAIICATNHLARMFRKITQIPVYNIAKCQGIDTPNTLVVLQGGQIDVLANNQLYVALTRHSQRLSIIVDPPHAALLTQLCIETENMISYADALGGSSNITQPIFNYIIESNMNRLLNDAQVMNYLTTICALQSGKISPNTMIVIMDQMNSHYNNCPFKFVRLREIKDIKQLECVVSLYGIQCIVYNISITDERELLCCLLTQVTTNKHIKEYLRSLPNRFAATGKKLCYNLYLWLSKFMKDNASVLSTYLYANDTIDIGGGVDLCHVLWLAINGVRSAFMTLIHLLDDVGNKLSKYTDGSYAAEQFKELLIDTWKKSNPLSFGDLKISSSVISLFKIFRDHFGSGIKTLWDFIQYVVKNMREWWENQFNNDKPIYYELEGTSMSLIVTDSPCIDIMRNSLDGDYSLIDGSPTISNTQYITTLDNLIDNSTIGWEKKDVPSPTCEDCPDDIQEVLDEIEVLFDYEAETNEKYDSLIDNEHHESTHECSEPEVESSPCEQKNEKENIKQNQCLCIETCNDWQLADTIVTSLDLNTYKPNLMGRMVIEKISDGIKINLKLPGVGKFNAVTKKCCGDNTHLIYVTVNGEQLTLKISKIASGYELYCMPDVVDVNFSQLEQAIKMLSKLGGGKLNNGMTLLVDSLKITRKFIKKLVRLTHYKLKYLMGTINLRHLTSNRSNLEVYRTICHRLPTSYGNSKFSTRECIGGTVLSTIELIPNNAANRSEIFIAIYNVNGDTQILIFTNDNNYSNYITRRLMTPVEHGNFAGDRSAISALLRLGIDIKSILTQDNDLTIDDIKKWLLANPLTSMFDVTDQRTYNNAKEHSIVEKHLFTDIHNILDKPLDVKYAFCIPSGHGKTTTVNRIRRSNQEFTVLDVDEVQEQATILHLGFEDKMLNYKEKLEKYIANSTKPPDAVFIHSPICAPAGYKVIIILNDGADVPLDRIWSDKNVCHLESMNNIIHTQNYDDVYNVTINYLNKKLTGDITLEDGTTIVDNIDSILGDSFMRNHPGYDDIYRLPTGKQDILNMNTGNIGLGEQRFFKTGPHPEVMRPTVNKMPSALPNAIMTRLMGRVKYRTVDLTIKDYHKLMTKFFIKGYESKLASYTDDPINLNYEDILNWLVAKGNKIQLLDNMLRSVKDDEFATDPANINVHYKVENLMKEQVNDILDQVGRVIVWNNQNINMYACPVINEAKARFKSLLKPNVIYTDGMTVADMNKSIGQYKSKWLLEMDLSKQDRQTDAQILIYEWKLMGMLGVPDVLIEFMTSFIPTFRINGTSHETAKLPAIHFSGGAMTSMGNEIRNLLLLSDCIGNNYVAIYTLGDDSLVLMNTKPDLELYKRICASRHNVENTAVASTNCALFLQMIVARNEDGTYYLSHNFARLKEKLVYSTYPNTSSDWKMKYASYLMMIGYSAQTKRAMEYSGFVSFPSLGTTMSQRVSANALYNEINDLQVFNIINDIINAKEQISEEIIIQLPVIMTGSKLKSGMSKVGKYVDNHNTMHELLIQYMEEHTET